MNIITRFVGIFRTAQQLGAQQEIPAGDLLRKRAEFKVVAVSLTAMFSLLMIRYFGDAYYLYEFLRLMGFTDLPAQFIASPHSELVRLGWWVAVVAFFYLVVPAAVVLFVFKESLSGYGFRVKGIKKDAWLYLLMLGIMIPLVWWMAHGSAFQAKYPYYSFRPGEGIGPDFWIWEGMNLFQFFSLEFFFRGFMVHGTKQRLGYYSIFLMCIPYCMIHFTKPVGETFGAIAAGITLGALSLKSNSIWLGVLIHYSVALTMDLMALWFEGMG